MIYAIKAVGTGFVKIGFTDGANADRRLDSLQTGCPHELKIIAICPGERVKEQRFHGFLKHSGAHVRGEWFRACPETDKVISWIRYLAKKGEPEIPAQQQDDKFKSLLAQIPSFQRTRARLGRVLEYAQRVASPSPDSPTSPTGTSEALQPNTSLA